MNLGSEINDDIATARRLLEDAAARLVDMSRAIAERDPERSSKAFMVVAGNIEMAQHRLMLAASCSDLIGTLEEKV